jgi:hypothetical protein
MKAVSLLYHDVVRYGDVETSGFPGEGAARYKLSSDEFDLHLATLDQVLKVKPVTVSDALRSPEGGQPVMLTFDDGGISAYPGICDALDRYGWKGHFFITTNYIGKPTFVSEDDIRALSRRGAYHWQSLGLAS